MAVAAPEAGAICVLGVCGVERGGFGVAALVLCAG